MIPSAPAVTETARWTAEDDATLVRLIDEGNSASQIAKELGRSRSAVCGRALRKKLHFTSQIQRPAVRNVRPTKTLERFTAAEDKIIIEMAADGKSGLDISEAIKRSKSSVVKRARLLGAKLNGKNGPRPRAEPKAPVAGNIAGKKASSANDPDFNHVTPVVVEPLMVALVDLRPSHCRFPVGDPREEGFGFCGHPKADGVYCLAHARLCYTAPEMRRRAA